VGIDEMDDEVLPPRKWLDKKQYVCMDPLTNTPQLIRIEPIIMDGGTFVADRVIFYIDDDARIMDRDAAEVLLETMKCSPLEVTAQWKHLKVN
jgi:hypothetical protein